MATIAEAAPHPVDDNFTVAVFSGMAMQIAARLLFQYEMILWS